MSKKEKKDNPFEVWNESFIREYHYTYCNNALENMGIIYMQRHKMWIEILLQSIKITRHF